MCHYQSRLCQIINSRELDLFFKHCSAGICPISWSNARSDEVKPALRIFAQWQLVFAPFLLFYILLFYTEYLSTLDAVYYSEYTEYSECNLIKSIIKCIHKPFSKVVL